MRRLRSAARDVAARFRPGAYEPRSELIVPVDCARILAESSSARYPGALACDHVTLLDPFVAPDRLDSQIEAAVAGVLQEFQPFHFRLARLARFPGVLYLEPEPAEPFVAMTRALHRRFPDHPPYGGAYQSIVPHVTLVLGPEPAGLAEHAMEQLPLHGRAEHVWLKERARDGTWSVRRRFDLGRSA